MPDLEKNSVHTVNIGGYTSNGLGVARIDENVVFVENALRHEICKIRIQKVLSKTAYAKPIDIIAPSQNRIEPVCENFGKCGGCDFLHMDYSEELELKRMRVEDALRRIGGFDITVPETVGSDKTESYRNKAVYAVGKAGGRAVAGFFRQRSHDIIPADRCAIQSDVSRRAAAAVIQWMNDFDVSPFDELTRKGTIRRVFNRSAAAANTAQTALVAAKGRIGHLDELISGILEYCPETSSIVLNVNQARGNTVLSGDFRVLWGDDRITDELCGLTFRLSPLSFYQINREQAEKLYHKAAEYAALTKNDTALDLYCGAGAITLLLSRYAARVIGAENVADAVADARINAKLNGIDNAEFICADALVAAETLKRKNTSLAAVVVDPPRRGLSADVIAAVANLSPGRVVYISCDPATLARDLKSFREYGYPLLRITPFDMFPRCAHVECCCLMAQAPAPPDM